MLASLRGTSSKGAKHMAPTVQTTGNVARLAGLIDMGIIEYAVGNASLSGIAATLIGQATELTVWDARIVASLITEVAQTLYGASTPLA